MLARCCEIQALGCEMLVAAAICLPSVARCLPLCTSMLARCCHMPMLGASFCTTLLRALCSHLLGLCNIIAVSGLAPRAWRRGTLGAALGAKLGARFGAGLGAEIELWRHFFFWRRVLAPKPIIFGAISCFGAGFQFLVPNFGAGDSLGRAARRQIQKRRQDLAPKTKAPKTEKTAAPRFGAKARRQNLTRRQKRGAKK